MRTSRFSTLFVFAILLSMAAVANAQPFGSYLSNGATGHTFVQVPHSPALNLNGGFTIEAWVIAQTAQCKTVVGKNWNMTYWVGLCREGTATTTQVRSYVSGSNSAYTAGSVPAGRWAHIAVTSDGTTRKHYVNGELVGTRTDTVPIGTSPDDLRIASDVSWTFSPIAVDEVRIWNVARTIDEIRSTINTPITTARPNLVAAYQLTGNGNNALGTHHGTVMGSGGGFLNIAVGACVPSDTVLCAQAGRYRLQSFWQTDTTNGVGHVVPGSSGNSGLFWFFTNDNWEVLAKVLDGCLINNKKWVFSAATTNVHYDLYVEDLARGEQRVYFNYQGVNAPALNDVEGFATCP